MKTYDFVYTICVWGTNPDLHKRLRFLSKHFEFLSSYCVFRDTSVLFVVAQRGFNETLTEYIYQSATTLPTNVDCVVLRSPNRGMLVGSLWDTYQHLKLNKIPFKYLCAMEDDWFFNHWNERAKILDTEKLVYLGMFSHISFGNPQDREAYKKYVRDGYKSAPNEIGFWVRPFVPEKRWTDGGCYFCSDISLQRMEAVIGEFNKAPKTEIINNSDYGLHGINYGEVGFPTELHAHGLFFRAFTDFSYSSNYGDWIDPCQETGFEPFLDGFLDDNVDCFLSYYPREITVPDHPWYSIPSTWPVVPRRPPK